MIYLFPSLSLFFLLGYLGFITLTLLTPQTDSISKAIIQSKSACFLLNYFPPLPFPCICLYCLRKQCVTNWKWSTDNPLFKNYWDSVSPVKETRWFQRLWIFNKQYVGLVEKWEPSTWKYLIFTLFHKKLDDVEKFKHNLQCTATRILKKLQQRIRIIVFHGMEVTIKYIPFRNWWWYSIWCYVKHNTIIQHDTVICKYKNAIIPMQR